MRICPNCKTVCTDAEERCSNCGKIFGVSSPSCSTSGSTNADKVLTNILLSIEEQNTYLRTISFFCKIMLVLMSIGFATALICAVILAGSLV